MIKINFRKMIGLDYLKMQINRLAQRVRTLNDPLNKIADDEIKLAQDRIKNTKTDPNDHEWPEWAPSTARGRERDGTAARGILYKTGRLHDSFEYNISGGNRLQIFNTAPYARYHQEGNWRLPKRKFMLWNKGTQSYLVNIYKKHLELNNK